MAVLIRDCPHCPATNSSFKIPWSEKHVKNDYLRNCIAICGACGNPICFVAKSGSLSDLPHKDSSNIEPPWTIEGRWPTRTKPKAPPHTPPAVKGRYEEGEDAFSRGKWNSAVAMYRSALDIATKGMEGVPEGVKFFKRLEWLHENHAITPDIRSWADHVRVEGNAALHDVDEFDKSDATALRFFTEMFLRYVFELPGAVREFRGAPESTTPPMAKPSS